MALAELGQNGVDALSQFRCWVKLAANAFLVLGGEFSDSAEQFCHAKDAMRNGGQCRLHIEEDFSVLQGNSMLDILNDSAYSHWRFIVHGLELRVFLDINLCGDDGEGSKMIVGSKH